MPRYSVSFTGDEHHKHIACCALWLHLLTVKCLHQRGVWCAMHVNLGAHCAGMQPAVCYSATCSVLLPPDGSFLLLAVLLFIIVCCAVYLCAVPAGPILPE